MGTEEVEEVEEVGTTPTFGVLHGWISRERWLPLLSHCFPSVPETRPARAPAASRPLVLRYRAMSDVLAALIAERDRIDQTIAILGGGAAPKRRGRPPGAKNKTAAKPRSKVRPSRKADEAEAVAQKKMRMKVGMMVMVVYPKIKGRRDFVAGEFLSKVLAVAGDQCQVSCGVGDFDQLRYETGTGYRSEVYKIPVTLKPSPTFG